MSAAMPATTRLSRLLIPLPSTRMGGTERHTLELAGRLAARTGIAVDLAAEPALHPALRARLPAGVALHDAALGWETAEPRAARADRQAAETRRLLAALGPDAAFVPLPWPDAGSGSLPVLAEAALPRVVLLHLAPEAPPPVPALGLGGAVLAAVSAPVARRGAAAWGVEERAIAVLDNPAPAPASVDRAMARAMLRSGLGLPPDARVLLFVGRLEKVKGAELLPKISARLQVTLACAGDGPLRGMLDEAAAADPRGGLRMLGPLPDLAPYYRAADGLLMPSRLEGAPLVFLEAAANRCPVVATRAALEALGEEASRLAFLAPSPDVRGMAEAAGALLAAPDRAAQVAELAAAHAARLTWDDAVERALGLLRAAALVAGRTP
jgi:glycosyltransferase involved in cell wall biosynthesis